MIPRQLRQSNAYWIGVSLFWCELVVAFGPPSRGRIARRARHPLIFSPVDLFILMARKVGKGRVHVDEPALQGDRVVAVVREIRASDFNAADGGQSLLLVLDFDKVVRLGGVAARQEISASGRVGRRIDIARVDEQIG